MEFSKQKYWSGLPFPSPGDLPDPGIKPRPPALQAEALPSEPPGKPLLPLGTGHHHSTFYFFMYQYFTPFYDSTVFHFKDIIFFIHSSINEHFDFFNLLNIVNSAAVNNMQVLFEQLFSVFLGLYEGVELLSHWVFLYLAC